MTGDQLKFRQQAKLVWRECSVESQALWCFTWGDDKDGLAPVFRALEVSSVPVRIFRPTHVNRNEKLLEEGYEFLKRGGYIDLTYMQAHFTGRMCSGG